MPDSEVRRKILTHLKELPPEASVQPAEIAGALGLSIMQVNPSLSAAIRRGEVEILQDRSVRLASATRQDVEDGKLKGLSALPDWIGIPAAILNEAIRHFEALRYLWGIPGTAAAAAIAYLIVEHLQNPRVWILTGLIILVGFFFMVLFWVFHRLTKDESPTIRLGGIILTCFVLILIMATSILLFTSAFFRWPRDLGNYIEPEDELVRELDRIRDSALEPQPLESAITTLTNGLTRWERPASRKASHEFRFRLATLYNILVDLYEAGSSFGRALEANEKEFHYLKQIYDAEPLWRPTNQMLGRASTVTTLNIPPVAIDLLTNRLRRTYLVYARLDGEPPSTDTQRSVLDALNTGMVALQEDDVRDTRGGLLWSGLCWGFWANGNLNEAIGAWDRALQCTGPPPLSVVDPARGSYFGDLFLDRAALEAERGNRIDALMWATKAEKLVIDPRQRSIALGHVYLLIARASKTVEEQNKVMDSAYKYLKEIEEEPSNRYNLACILSKKSESGDEPSRIDCLRQSKEQLEFVLKRISTLPVQADISAIRKDPFLKSVLKVEEIDHALRNFEWKPPAGARPFPVPRLRFIGIPAKRVRFTKLNLSPVE
jgi:tetratricopeptide (TPR) repeat protein